MSVLRSIRSREQFDDSKESESNREVVIFTEALKVSVQERAAFLANACGGDEDLRRKVEALLRAHDRLRYGARHLRDRNRCSKPLCPQTV